MSLAPGQEERTLLKNAGFTEKEILEWENETKDTLLSGGFSEKEVNEYFGFKEADFSGLESQINENLEKLSERKKSESNKTQEGKNQKLEEEREAESFIEALEAGFDISVSGLLRERPDVVLPKDASTFYRIASGIGTLAGDIPAMIGGAVAGGTGGAALGTVTIPVIGTVGVGAIGAFAGSNALPEAMRAYLMEKYEKGEVQSFSDFWERASVTFLSGAKGAAIGAATGAAGGIVGNVLGKTAAPQILRGTTRVAAEVGTMVTVGSALEGQVPEPEHFLDAAILIGGLHGSVSVASKLRKIYAKTGIKPEQIAAQAEFDPKLKSDILSENIELPQGLSPLGDITKVKPETAQEILESLNPKKETLKLKEPDPKVKEPVPLDADVESVLSQVKDKPKKPGIEIPTFDEFYADYVDKLDPIKKAIDVLVKDPKEVLAEENPYMQGRMSVDAAAKAKHVFEKGTIDFDTAEINGKSLIDILDPVKNNYQEFTAFVVSKRAIEKNAQGKAAGFPIEKATAVVAKYGKQFEKVAKELTEFQNRNLEYVKKSGLLSDDQLASIKELNKDYVPFKRIFEPNDKVGAKKGGGRGGSLKEFRGSDRAIQDPLNSIIDNTVELFKLAEINRAKKSLIELANKSEGQEIIIPVKKPMRKIDIKAKELARELGIPEEKLENISIFRPVTKDLASDEFAVFIDGKRQIYKTTPELAEALNTLGGNKISQNLAFKIANGLTTVKKIGITLTPDFIVRNAFRDFITGKAYMKDLTLKDIFSAASDLIKRNDNYYEWLKSGGANGAFLEMGDFYIKNNILKLQRETNFMNSARNVVDKPMEFMRIAAELSEQSIRLAAFKNTFKKTGSRAQAGMASREITIDFQRIGAKMSALNAITAFQNVAIQGLDRSARAFKEDPKGLALRAGMYITAPSLLLWWAQKDDPRYQEIPRWQKDLFWVVLTDKWVEANEEEASSLPDYLVRRKNGKVEINKGTTYRLPKPHELGILFGSLPERILETFFGQDAQALKDFEDTMLELVTPSVVPDIAIPAVEQYFNKSLFTGRDIIPSHLEMVENKYQYTNFTSETGKILGKLIGKINPENPFASPIMLDHYMRSWTGSLGAYVLDLADKGLKKTGIVPDNIDPESTLADIPFIKSFVVRFPSANARSVQDFYDNYKKVKKTENTLKLLIQRGDPLEVETFISLQRNQENLIRLDGVKKAMSNMSKAIQIIHQNPDMTPDEKRQMIDSLYYGMIESARAGNELYMEFKNSMKENE